MVYSVSFDVCRFLIQRRHLLVSVLPVRHLLSVRHLFTTATISMPLLLLSDINALLLQGIVVLLLLVHRFSIVLHDNVIVNRPIVSIIVLCIVAVSLEVSLYHCSIVAKSLSHGTHLCSNYSTPSINNKIISILKEQVFNTKIQSDFAYQ